MIAMFMKQHACNARHGCGHGSVARAVLSMRMANKKMACLATECAEKVWLEQLKL